MFVFHFLFARFPPFFFSFLFAKDLHDIVLRFNNAPTKGHEKDVGSKTTIRVVNSQVSVLSIVVNNFLPNFQLTNLSIGRMNTFIIKIIYLFFFLLRCNFAGGQQKRIQFCRITNIWKCLDCGMGSWKIQRNTTRLVITKLFHFLFFFLSIVLSSDQKTKPKFQFRLIKTRIG